MRDLMSPIAAVARLSVLVSSVMVIDSLYCNECIREKDVMECIFLDCALDALVVMPPLLLLRRTAKKVAEDTC